MRFVHIMTATALALTVAGCREQSDCTCRCRFEPDSTQSASPSATTFAPSASAAVAAVPATAAAPAVPAAPQSSSDKILIGHVGSMTGSEAAWGDLTEKGLKLAIDEQNSKGGVRGKLIAFKTVDDHSKAEDAAAAAKQLITQDKVTLIVGEVASSRSIAVAAVADAYQVPQVVPSSVSPQVTKDGDRTRPYVFRVCWINPFQGTVMAKFAREVLKVYKVAILREAGSVYSVGLADFFTVKFKELGGGILSDQSYKSGEQDFKPLLASLQKANPEAIFVPGYYTDVALIARQARELGMKAPLLGGDGWDSSKLLEYAKGALDGSYYSNHYSDQDPSPVIQDFVKKFKATFGILPDSQAVLAYDAAKVAFDAIGRAKDLSSTSIRDALATTKGFPAVTGVITLDADHNALKPAVVIGIDKNSPYYAATITP
jgi:branched-chain amino acid transport system substrate-binding protein